MGTSSSKSTHPTSNVNNKEMMLIHAAKNGQLETVREIIKSVNYYDVNNMFGKALLEATLNNHLDVVQLLLQSKANPDYQIPNEFGYTALFHAARNNNVDIINLLLQYGASVNTRSQSGETALIYATKYGQSEAAQALIKAGADTNIKDKNGWGNSALIIAVEKGYSNIVRALIQNGANVNIQDEDGNTPLMNAIIHNKIKIVNEFLSLNANRSNINLNIQNQEGETALMLAIMYGNLEAAIQLISQGAKLDLQAQFGFTALMIAVGGGYKEVVDALIKHGADLNIKNKIGANALIIAVITNPARNEVVGPINTQVEIFDLLLSKGAIIDPYFERDVMDDSDIDIKFKSVLIRYRNAEKINALRKDNSSYFSVIPNDLIGVIKNNF